MALALKYSFKCKSNYSNEVVTAEIYQEAFVGSARTFSAGWGPRNCVVVKTDNAELDPLFPIRSKVLSINLFIDALDDDVDPFTETDYTDITFSDDREFQCVIDVNGVTKFIGWFTPQDTVSLSPYAFGQASLVFTDGLSALKGIDYQLTDQYEYLINSYREIIFECLDNTGLELDIYYSNGLYIGVDTEMLIDNVGIETPALRETSGMKAISCYEVLTLAMRSIGSCLFQKDGEWHIEAFADKSQTVEYSATILYSAPSGTVTLASGTFATDTLVNANRFAVERSMICNLYRPKSKVNATADYTMHAHAGLNYLFRDFTGNNPDQWTFSSGLIVTRQASGGGANGCDIQGYANGTVGFVDEYIRTVAFPVKKGSRLLIDWRFNTLATDGAEVPQVRVQIRVNDSNDMAGVTINESLKEDGTWQAGIYWIQQGNTGVFGEVVEVDNDGFLFMLIGRPYLSSAGIASQTTYYVSCEFFDVTVLNGRNAELPLNADFNKAQQLISTGKISMFVDDEILALGNSESETIPGVDPLSDYFVTVHKTPDTRDNMPENVRNDELLAGAQSLLLAIARIRGMLLSSNMVSIDVGLYGYMVDLFDILTITILGSSRRMVVVAIETDLKQERQTVTLIEAKIALEASLSNTLNLIQ